MWFGSLKLRSHPTLFPKPNLNPLAQHPPPSDNTNPAVYDGPMLFKYVLLQAHSSSSSKLKNVLSERGKVLSIVEDDPNHTWLAHRLVGILEHNMLLRRC